MSDGFPALDGAHSPEGHRVSWRSWDRAHREDASVRWDNEAYTAQVQMQGARCEYVLRLGPDWRVRQLLLFRDLDEPDLWLANDGAGRWGEMQGARRPELDGAVDVHVAASPFVHTPAIRRLGLAVGGRAEVRSVMVDPETLEARAVDHVYLRTADDRWVHTDHAGAETLLTVDGVGVVIEAEGVYTRDDARAVGETG